MSERYTVSRRSVLAAAPAAALLSASSGRLAGAADPARRPKIAALVTEIRKLSHGEVIVDRFLEGFGWEGAHYHPAVELVSMYVDQFPEGDLARERAARHKDVTLYPTIKAALCLGGERLAVDGVVIIGEHGRYPVNEKGQTQYPRYEFFRQTVDVFRTSGRSVPVFNDKHLSWKWDWAKEMVDTASSMGFPLASASSVPISWRIPSVEMPLGAEVDEIVAVGNGNVDSYDFHVLEAMQSLVERRKGGETGVAWLEALKGDQVWKALAGGSWNAGGWDPALFEACLCRSQQLAPSRAGFSNDYPTPADMARIVRDPVAYRFQYRDGLRGTMLLLNPLVGDITVAARVKGQSEPLSTLMYLGGDHETQPHNFDILVKHIEQFVITGKPVCPLERTLLTTGLVAAGVDSLAAGGRRLETPHLAIRYQPHKESTFRRT